MKKSISLFVWLIKYILVPFRCSPTTVDFHIVEDSMLVTCNSSLSFLSHVPKTFLLFSFSFSTFLLSATFFFFFFLLFSLYCINGILLLFKNSCSFPLDEYRIWASPPINLTLSTFYSHSSFHFPSPFSLSLFRHSMCKFSYAFWITVAVVKDMARSGYGSSSELEYALAFRWVKLSSFCTVLHNFCTVQFGKSFMVSDARTNLINVLSSHCPFSNYNRFPENNMYVCVDKPPLFAQVAEVMRVLATPYEKLTVEAIKDYFSAIARMRELMHSQKGGNRVVFSRATFEHEFELNWVDWL